MSVTPEPILQLASGFISSKHLFVANELGLFSHLADGPLTLDQLAERTGAPTQTVRIPADAMVALGILERRADDYANSSAAARFLTGNGPVDLRPLLRFWNHISYPTWTHLEEAVRSGRAPNLHGEMSQDDQRIYSEGVEAFTAGPAHALAATYDFGRHQRLLDVCGGTGSFLLAAIDQHHDLRGSVFELPDVAAVARDRVAQHPRGHQVDVVAGDVFNGELPTGHDAFLLAMTIHLFSPEHNLELLRRCRAAADRGARLLLVDFWTDTSHTDPVIASLLAGEFRIIAGEGDVYSEGEARSWLSATGWRFIERTPLAGPPSVIVAEAE